MRAESALRHYCPSAALARTALDLKVSLARCELAHMIGYEGVDSILRLAASCLSIADRERCGDSPRLVLRRTAASPARDGTVGQERHIAFHRDFCRAVVSVALSELHQGGHLVFAIDGHVHCPARPVGSAIAHNRTAVHAVSPITSGVRYNLIAIFGDAFEDQVHDGVALWAQA